MILISGFILFLYCLLILSFIIGFDKVEYFKTPDISAKSKFSIIIPFRNEVENIPALLQSILLINYPKESFEVLMIDDDSEDSSVSLITEFKLKNNELNIKILTNSRESNSPKKEAIETAISQAKNDWIITTDADCIVPFNWLQIFDRYIKKHQPQMIVGSVTYIANSTLFEQFQLLDFLSLQASTIGSFGIGKPFLCNGANLCYKKQAFNKVNGFTNNKHIASGDDIFLLEKILKHYPDKVKYLKSKNAIVKTKPQPTFKNLLSQRIRWAAKTTTYNSNFAKLVALIVLLMNLLIVLTIVLSFLNLYYWQLTTLIIFIKFIFDYLLLKKIYRLYNEKLQLHYYFLGSIFYPFFSMFVTIASFQSTYNWKGRQFKK